MNTTDTEYNHCSVPEQPVPLPDDVETLQQPVPGDVGHDPCEVLQQPVPDKDDDLPAAKKARLEGPTLWQRIIAWLPWLSGQG